VSKLVNSDACPRPATHRGPARRRRQLREGGVEGGRVLGVPGRRLRAYIARGDTVILANVARRVLGWPERYELAHAFLWEYSCKRLKLAQLLGQLGVFLTLHSPGRHCHSSHGH
jgi:hypothetical protein